MKKLVLSLILVFLAQNITLAIDWVKVVTPLNRIAYVDVDSITEYKNYYFYNIKYQNKGNDIYTILTVQSSKSSPLSARLKTYTEEEYKALNGDYNNITANIKPTLESVTYHSVINTCYNEVKTIKSAEIFNSIIIENEADEQ